MRWSGVGLALVAVLWAYNGLHDMVGVPGEVRDPGRVLPRALRAGSVVVIAAYLAANAAYLYVMPFDALRASPLVASDTMVRVLGAIGAGAVAVMVMVSTSGAVMGLGLATPRIFYAMAGAGLLFAPLARVHPRFRTPHVAVAAYTAGSPLCVWSRTFEQLTEAFVLGTWPFLARRGRGARAAAHAARARPAIPHARIPGRAARLRRGDRVGRRQRPRCAPGDDPRRHGAPPPTTAAQKANVALYEQNEAEWRKILEELERMGDEVID